MKSKTTIKIGDSKTLGLLFIAFVVLKLTGVINWSWWWVTSPMWIPAALFLSVLFIVGLIKLIFKKKNNTIGEKIGKILDDKNDNTNN